MVLAELRNVENDNKGMRLTIEYLSIYNMAREEFGYRIASGYKK